MKIAICDDNEKELNSLKYMIEQYCSSMQLVYQLSTYFSGEELLNENINFDEQYIICGKKTDAGRNRFADTGRKLGISSED